MVIKASLRETYGKTLVELGQKNQDIVVLDADLSHSTMTHYFGAQFPERFFNCGIAEQNMIGIAAGLAASGKIPFASTFAVFAPGRCFDQIRVSVAQPHLNVKIVTTHGGITVGEDGMSHQAIEDLSLMCSLPGFNVIVPADAIETAQAVKLAAATKGPFYIRLCR
ncbi:MAG TPA: transketolase family protein, partial [Dehalococcoidales bacterium]|nr:transketolase family protein [Dehalococcoidales bacterium]